MAEPQPQKLKEGATGGDVEDEVQDTAKSAEDRKAAAAMASMDTNGGGDDAGSSAVDKEAASKAMKSLGGAGAVAEAGADNKKVKVDAADVALLVDQLDLTKPKATALLKANDGDAIKAMKAHIAV